MCGGLEVIHTFSNCSVAGRVQFPLTKNFTAKFSYNSFVYNQKFLHITFPTNHQYVWCDSLSFLRYRLNVCTVLY